MKVLLVNGSPHKGGCTYTALLEASGALNENGIDTDIFWIGNKPLSGCIACKTCVKKHACVFDDTVNEFLDLAGDYDGFVFGTPVHWGAATGAITSFLDRAFYADFCGGGHRFLLKPAGLAISARRAGTTATWDQMNKYFGLMQMPIITSRYWNMVHGATPEEVRKDAEGMQVMRILAAAMKAVRQYGLEGVRIQNVSALAEVSPGAIYRYFESKDQLLVECFTYVDKQAAKIFDQIDFNPLMIRTDPVGAVKAIWLPYFRFWTSHPDETVFYHRFRDSAAFPQYDKIRDVHYFGAFVKMVNAFKTMFPGLDGINQDLLWLHVLTSTVMYAKYVVEGVLPDNQETEDTVFQLLVTGLSGYLWAANPQK